MPAHTLNGEDVLDALDISTVCRRARVGRSFVYEEIRAGRLIARKYGRLTRVLIGDYHRWLDDAPPIEPKAAEAPAQRSGAAGSVLESYRPSGGAPRERR